MLEKIEGDDNENSDKVFIVWQNIILKYTEMKSL
jgi:hypothetical protein